MKFQNRVRSSKLLTLTALSTLFLALALCGSTQAAPSGAITGVVKTADGQALRGATVTAAAGGRSVSRFTDASGRYTISDLEPGSYSVSVTAWGFERKTETADLSGKQELSFQLAQAWQPGRLTSADWYASLPRNEDTKKLEYQCMGCHNASEIIRHKGSTAEQWQEIVAPMGRNVLNEDEVATPRKYALEWLPVLEKYFGPDAPAPTRDNTPKPEINDVVLRATFREYNTPKTTYVHSITVDPVADQVYFTEIDRATNGLGQFDIKTQQMTEHKFTSDFTQPHNAIVAPDGKVWVSLNNAKMVGMFDPKTGKLSEFPTVAVGHTIDLDWSGNVWESGPGVFRYDPKSGKSQLYYLPKFVPDSVPEGGSTEVMAMDSPPADGSSCHTYDLSVGVKNDVWFTCSNPGYVGRLDPETNKIKMYRVANAGAMKGITVDPVGNVWFSSFSDHKLGKIDAKTDQMKLYQPPTSHAGIYGITIDRNGNGLWFAEYEGSHITHFDPKTEQFIEYPLPRPDAMPRFMGQDGEGRLWYTEWRGKIGMLDPGIQTSKHDVTKIVRASRQ
jgi:virginiamycin B lyase